MTDEQTKYNGILLLNKPPNITSHQAVVEIRQAIRQRRAGHTGTLDPKAEGLLVICIGRATKIVQFVSDFDKSYEAEIFLGKRSTTFDSEGVLEDDLPKAAPDFSVEEFADVLSEFKGSINQKVPSFSAVRIQGKRLYESARSGEEVERPERLVEIDELEVISYDKPILKLKVSCSKGTYIRTLADDIGNKLECGAYLAALKRTSVSGLLLENALTIDEVNDLHQSGRLEEQLLSLQDVLDYSGICVSDDFKDKVINGTDLTSSDVSSTDGQFATGDKVLLKDKSGNALAIGRAEIDSSELPNSDDTKIFTYSRVLN
jgi:tRNA pseudouridine55 synthase